MIKLSSEAAQVLVAKVCEAGQEHVLAWWEDLDPGEQKALLDQIREIDLQLLAHLINRHLKGGQREKVNVGLPDPVQPERIEELGQEASKLKAVGQQALMNGEVAVLMAAGERRRDEDTFIGLAPVGPLTQKTLLQLHIEKVLALSRQYHSEVPLLIMTSAETRPEIEAFLKEYRFFTLPQASVMIVDQPRLPLVDRRGKILLSNKSTVAMAPNGCGGAVEVLKRKEVREFLQAKGIKHVFYFQVDNLLVQIADPLFVGFHIEREAEVSVKAARRMSPSERIGILVKRGKSLSVLEQSEVSPPLKAKRDPQSGELIFAWGNTAIHMFSYAFIESWERENRKLDYHCTKQRVACLDRKGKRFQPAKSNAYRFECYIFDSFKWASRWAVLEADRQEEFFPIGGTSPKALEAAKKALSQKYARWLEYCGVNVPRGPRGQVRGTYEVSPLFALDKEELKEKWDGSKVQKPERLCLE